MDYVITNGELYHHGVKGMKWGVRKARKQRGGILRKKTSREMKYEEEHGINGNPRRKPKGVVYANSTNTSRGRRAAKSVLRGLGTATIATAATAATLYTSYYAFLKNTKDWMESI